MILLINEAQLLSGPCHTNVEETPRLTKRPVTLVVTPVRDIAIVDAEQDDGVELATFSAVEGAQGNAAGALDPAGEDIERHVAVMRRIGPGHHFGADFPFLVGVADDGLPWFDQVAAKAAQPCMGGLTRINAAA
jgi:hypothetical protein